MPVKPAVGEVVEETKRTRVIPLDIPNDKAQHERHPPIWDFVESLSPADWQTGDYQFVLYRGKKTQSAEEKPWLGKFYELINPEIIQARWGGGDYNVWLKVRIGGTAYQLRYNVDLKIDGPPRTSVEPVVPTAGDASSQMIAMFRDEMRALREEIREARGGSAASDAVRSAIQLNGEVFKSGVQTVTGVIGAVQNPTHAPNPMDDLMKQFMAAAITKMMNPVDSIEQFSKMIAAMNALGLNNNSRAGGSLAAEAIRGLTAQLPTVVSHVSGIMDNYRRAKEAEMQQVALIRGAKTIEASVSQPAAQMPSIAVMPAPGGAPPVTAQENSAMAQQQSDELFQYIEKKIVELVTDESISPEDAAGDALTFIDVTDKRITDELLKHGEAGIHWAFQNRPILKQIQQGPRLDAFIAEFVKLGRKVGVAVTPDPRIPPA